MAHGRAPVPSDRARPVTIGWKEYVDFPDWGLRRVKVKMDTGARTSALGVASYELRPADDGGMMVELRLALRRKHPARINVVRAPVLGWVTVRNTSGAGEQRPLIETTVRLGPVCKRVRLTITDRSRMLFPMILGRKALESDFLVDVSRKYLLRDLASGGG